MAKFAIQNFNNGDNLIDYLISLDARFAKISDTELSFDNKVNIVFSWSGDSLQCEVKVNDTILYNGTYTYNFTSAPNFRMVYAIGESFISIRTIRNNYNDRIHSVFIAVDDSGKVFAGGGAGAWGSTYIYTSGNPYNTKIYPVDDLATPYYFIRMFDYTSPPGKLTIAQMQPFSSVTGDLLSFTTGVYACSTVPINSTVVIMGDTFFALDTNTLIKMDMSED